MELKWKQSESLERPVDVDYESSPDIVYLRRNIIEKQRKDQNGESVLFYSYQEAKLTPAQYAVYQTQQNSENILAIMEVIAETAGGAE